MHFACVEMRVGTAILPIRIGRAMSCCKCSEINDSPMMAGMEWFLRTSSGMFI